MDGLLAVPKDELQQKIAREQQTKSPGKKRPGPSAAGPDAAGQESK
jgi:hypothetical protein